MSTETEFLMKCKEDPALFCRKVLGIEPWSKQEEILYSIRDNQNTIVVSANAQGKALGIDEVLPTPRGFVSMRDIKIGDEIYGADGMICHVVAMTPVHERTAYRVTFVDGASVVASGEHLWNVLSLNRRSRMKPQDWRHEWSSAECYTTAELQKAVRVRTQQQLNWGVPTAKELEGAKEDFSIAPYTLGTWLGDGTAVRSDITLGKEKQKHVLPLIQTEGFSCRVVPSTVRSGSSAFCIEGLYTHLRRNGLLGNKHIPMKALRSSCHYRLALLQGIMDTDGWIDKVGGSCHLDMTNKELLETTAQLVESLGWKACRGFKKTVLNGKCFDVWRLNFSPTVCVFSLPRKVDLWKKASRLGHRSKATLRTIKSIESVGVQNVRCIQVDRADGLFLATKHCIPTHNSFVSAAAALWFLLTHKDSIVLTTAPTYRQVMSVLWGEISRMYQNTRFPLGGEMTAGRLQIGPKWYALGLPSSEEVRFQGYHADDLLIVFDEAAGIEPHIYTAAMGNLTNPERHRMLLIGNPTSPSGMFYDYSKNPDWHKITLSALESPGYTDPAKFPFLATKDWCDQREREWGVSSPMYQARVLGRFPEEGEDTLIPLGWLERARKRYDLTNKDILVSEHVYLGVDVARMGMDKSVICPYQPNKVLPLRKMVGKDLTQVTHAVNQEAIHAGNKLHQITTDDTGVGCMPSGTLVLTAEGWRSVEDVKVGDLLCSRTLSGEVTFEKVWQVNALQAQCLTRDGVTFSEGHFVPVRSRIEHPVQLLPWNEIVERTSVILDTSLGWRGQEKDFWLPEYFQRMPYGGKKLLKAERIVPAVAFAKFLGWFVSEGHLDFSSHGQHVIGITQSFKNAEKCVKIRQVLTECGFHFTPKKGQTAWQFLINDVQLAAWLKKECYGGVPGFATKRVPQWLRENSSVVIKEFLTTFCAGDGHWHSGQMCLRTSSLFLKHDLSELAAKAGFSCSVRLHAKAGSTFVIEGRSATRTKDSWSIFLWRTAVTRWLKKTRVQRRKQTVYDIHIEGTSKLLFVRVDNQQPFWVHNGGLTDNLRTMGYPVLGINFSQKANNRRFFRRLKDEMMYNVREVFRADEIAIPPDEELIHQLSSIKYTIEQDTGLIEIESKEEMRKRGLKSPDCAWALALALWGSKRMRVSPQIRTINARRDREHRDQVWY